MSIIAATAGQSSIKQYIAPYIGCSVGEVYRDYGYNALIIYDTLTNHAIAHRQTSLLLKTSPGREAYPGDTFYIHAKLLERAAQLSKKLGYGSLTSLPIIETQTNNISAFIPTNIISITDGQVFLSSDLSKQKVYPAMDIEKSISRVGSNAQPLIMREITPILRKMLRDYYFYKDRLRLGYKLTAKEDSLYQKGISAYGVCKQRIPRFFEENVILIIAADNGLICPTAPESYSSLLLAQLYQPKYV